MSVRRRRVQDDAGHVYPRKDSPYLWMSYKFRGERVCESTRETVKRAAEKVLDRRLAEIEAGKYVGPEADVVKLSDLKELLRVFYESKGRKSWKRAALSMDKLIKVLGDVRARDVTDVMLDNYWDGRRKRGAADATTRTELMALNKAWAVAIRKKKLASNSRPGLPEMVINNTRTRFPSEKEFEAVLSRLPDGIRDMVEFLGMTGWRLGEAMNLRWSWVNMHEKTITLPGARAKNGESRPYPFAGDPGMEALLVGRMQASKELQLSRPGDEPVEYVFSRDGGPIRAYHFHWAKACEAAEVVDFHTHDLRRRAARNFIRAGVDKRVAMLMLGHKTSSIFDRYNVIEDEDVAAGVKLAAEARTARP